MDAGDGDSRPEGGNGKGKGRQPRRGQGKKPPRQGSGDNRQRGSGDRARANAGAGSQLEGAVKGARGAVRRHAEGLRDEQEQLACRALLMALHGNLSAADNPGEVLGAIEQVQHVLLATRRDDSVLPIAVRAAASFVVETPGRQRAAQEALRLLLRWGYLASADYLPRRPRDDARFRATTLLDVMTTAASEYLADDRFRAMQNR